MELSKKEDISDIVSRLKRQMVWDESQINCKNEPVILQSNEGHPKIPSQTVRLNIRCLKKTNLAKFIIVNRATTIADLAYQCRNKFKVSKNFNTLIIDNMNTTNTSLKKTGTAPTIRILTDKDLLSLEDDEFLMLVEQSDLDCDKKEPSTDIPPVGDNKQKEPVDSPFWKPPDINIDGEDDAIGLTGIPSIVPNSIRSNDMKIEFQAYQSSALYQTSGLKSSRNSLPIFSLREQILSTVAANQFVVIAGETGSGKTTQLPMYILEVLLLL